MQPLLRLRKDRAVYNSVNKKSYQHLRSALENCLERLECVKEDEFHFSSPWFVDGIPPFACEFAVKSSINHLLAAADEDGRVFLFNTWSNINEQAAQVKDWAAHNNAIFDLAWSYTEPRLVTASGDQSALLWDATTAQCLASFKQHRCSLKAVSFRPWDGHVFATGARDGSVMIWDDRCKKKGGGSGQLPVSSIHGAHVDPHQKKGKGQPKRRRKLAPHLPAIDASQSVSAVLFQKEDTLISAGSADGIVKFWDLRKLKSSGSATPTPSHQFPYSGTSNRKRGFSSLALTSTRTQLFASCTDSVIYEYDLRGVLSPKPVAQYRGHMNATFFVKATVSPDNLFLLSGSSNGDAYVWKIGQPEIPPMTLAGHDAEVTAVAWSPNDFTKLATCSDDNTMRIWRMGHGRGCCSDASRLIGKARRWTKMTSSDCMQASDSIGLGDSQPSQGSQASSSSYSSTPTSETGVPPLSPLGPMPPSTKKRKFSLKEWVTTSPKTSRPSSPSSKRRKSEKSELESSSDGVCREESSAGGAKKREAATDGKPGQTLCHGSPKRAKLTRGEQTDIPSAFVYSNGESRPQSATNATNQRLESAGDSTKNSGMASEEKENVSQVRQQDGRDSKPVTSSKTNPCQRSPLKDDILMNGASCSALGGKLPAKKNILECPQGSPKGLDGRGEEGGKAEKKQQQQQSLKECFKEKKLAGLTSNKRRGSSGTIDGYFFPLQKRRKSET